MTLDTLATWRKALVASMAALALSLSMASCAEDEDPDDPTIIQEDEGDGGEEDGDTGMETPEESES